MPVTLLCSCQMLCFQNQRSVISARRFHATRRVQSAARTAWLPSHVCASRAGRGRAVRKVSSHLVFWHFKHFSSFFPKYIQQSFIPNLWDLLLLFLCGVSIGQTSMSVQILNFMPDVIKYVRISQVASTACVKKATYSPTTSTAWVRLYWMVILTIIRLNWFSLYTLVCVTCVPALFFTVPLLETRHQQSFTWQLSIQDIILITFFFIYSYGCIAKQIFKKDQLPQLLPSGASPLVFCKADLRWLLM